MGVPEARGPFGGRLDVTAGSGAGAGISTTLVVVPSVSPPQSASTSSVFGAIEVSDTASLGLSFGAAFELSSEVSSPHSASMSSVGGGIESGERPDRLTLETGGLDVGFSVVGLRSESSLIAS